MIKKIFYTIWYNPITTIIFYILFSVFIANLFFYLASLIFSGQLFGEWVFRVLDFMFALFILFIGFTLGVKILERLPLHVIYKVTSNITIDGDFFERLYVYSFFGYIIITFLFNALIENSFMPFELISFIEIILPFPFIVL